MRLDARSRDVRAEQVDRMHAGHLARLVGSEPVLSRHRAAVHMVEVLEAMRRRRLNPQPTRAHDVLPHRAPFGGEVDGGDLCVRHAHSLVGGALAVPRARVEHRQRCQHKVHRHGKFEAKTRLETLRNGSETAKGGAMVT